MERTKGNTAAWFEATGKTTHEPQVSTHDRMSVAFERASARKKPRTSKGDRTYK